MGKFKDLAKLSSDQVAKDESAGPVVDSTGSSADQPTSRPRTQPVVGSAAPSPADTLIDTIRQGIREPGSRSGTHSFTDPEREWLEDLVHSLRRQGYRELSGNMVLRILLHAARHEHAQLGQDSLIERAVRSIL